MTLSDSDDSPLSSPPESDIDEPVRLSRTVDVRPPSKSQAKTRATKPPAKIKLIPPRPRSPTPPPKKRKKEPPHVPTLADSPELAFIVMFRSRFSDAFKGVPNLGCQDIEQGLTDATAAEPVEQLLCRLISLVLNRKKPVERGHHTRALEEVLHAHKAQWPRVWEGKSPISGGRTFCDMDVPQRLVLLKILINWALTHSDQIRAIITENYRGQRREDDIDVAISVQPWGRDGDRRRYWLIEGKDDTPFRLYRESSPVLKSSTWISVAGTIDEIRAVAKELEEDDSTKHALALKDKIMAAIYRFEEGESKRKKREYRASRKAFFQQPSSVSLYEGRTRGKRIKYTFSDEENDPVSDDNRSRHSARSLRGTPQPDAPRFTASGRQVRKPTTGAYGETKINGSHGTVVPSVAGSEKEDIYREYHVNGHESSDEAAVGYSPDEDADISEWDDSGFDDQLGEKKSLKITLKFKKDTGLEPSTSYNVLPTIRQLQPPSQISVDDIGAGVRILGNVSKKNGQDITQDVAMPDIGAF